jgi:hypothetical protein
MPKIYYVTFDNFVTCSPAGQESLNCSSGTPHELDLAEKEKFWIVGMAYEL